MFQSLFWWILYCDDVYFVDKGLLTIVSILVLVDLILWPGLGSFMRMLPDSFNPCFGGSYIVTRWKTPFPGQKLRFNPCFGGSYIVTKLLKNVTNAVQSFNPCFGGSYIVTDLLFSCRNKYLKFQSLFWWILYCDRIFELTKFTVDSFNPCLVDLILQDCFNYYSFDPNKFQSLFWWSNCDTPSWPNEDFPMCFNPFCGSIVTWKNHTLAYRLFVNLVLVDPYCDKTVYATVT